MELLQLRYFYDSSKTENFSKTAEKYMVPATSVSSSVKRLEKELGCLLFDRTANKITLNSNGKKLQKSLYIVFNELDQTINTLSHPDTDIREIKILICAIRRKITDYIIDYKTKYPHISFKTVFDFKETDYRNYDIIIADNPENYPEYEHFEICSTPVRLRASSSNPLCKKKITLKQLKDQPFISMGEQSSMYRLLNAECERAGFTPNIVVLANDYQCYDKCLYADVGISLERYIPEESDSAVQWLNVTDLNIHQTVYGFYNRQNCYGNVEHFINYLKSRTIYSKGPEKIVQNGQNSEFMGIYTHELLARSRTLVRQG